MNYVSFALKQGIETHYVFLEMWQFCIILLLSIHLFMNRHQTAQVHNRSPKMSSDQLFVDGEEMETTQSDISDSECETDLCDYNTEQSQRSDESNAKQGICLRDRLPMQACLDLFNLIEEDTHDIDPAVAVKIFIKYYSIKLYVKKSALPIRCPFSQKVHDDEFSANQYVHIYPSGTLLRGCFSCPDRKKYLGNFKPGHFGHYTGMDLLPDATWMPYDESTKWVEDIDPVKRSRDFGETEASIVAVQAGMGAGKTEAYCRLVHKCKKDVNILCISTRIACTKALVQRLNADTCICSPRCSSQELCPKKHQLLGAERFASYQDTVSSARLVIQYESLHRLSTRTPLCDVKSLHASCIPPAGYSNPSTPAPRFEPVRYDLIICDEMRSILRQANTAKTNKGNAIVNALMLEKLVTGAKQVLYLDADMFQDISVPFFLKEIHDQEDITIHCYSVCKRQNVMSVLTDADHWKRKIFEDLQAKKKVFVINSSLNSQRKLAEECESKLPGLALTYYDGKVGASKKDELVNINDAFEPYQLVLWNSVITVGNDHTGHVDAVYAHYEGGFGPDVQSFVQSCGRVRHPTVPYYLLAGTPQSQKCELATNYGRYKELETLDNSFLDSYRNLLSMMKERGWVTPEAPALAPSWLLHSHICDEVLNADKMRVPTEAVLEHFKRHGFTIWYDCPARDPERQPEEAFTSTTEEERFERLRPRLTCPQSVIAAEDRQKTNTYDEADNWVIEYYYTLISLRPNFHTFAFYNKFRRATKVEKVGLIQKLYRMHAHAHALAQAAAVGSELPLSLPTFPPSCYHLQPKREKGHIFMSRLLECLQVAVKDYVRLLDGTIRHLDIPTQSMTHERTGVVLKRLEAIYKSEARLEKPIKVMSNTLKHRRTSLDRQLKMAGLQLVRRPKKNDPDRHLLCRHAFKVENKSYYWHDVLACFHKKSDALVLESTEKSIS